MKLVIHAGRSKTGTSFLQSVLALNEMFLEKNGLHYPKLRSAIEMAARGLPTAGNAVLLAILLTKGGVLPSDVNEKIIMDDLVNCFKENSNKHVILSSELFEQLNLEGLEKLKEIAAGAGRELLFVQYIRNPVDSLESVYAQSVKRHGVTLDPFDYVLSLRMWAVKYHLFLEYLTEMDISFVAKVYDKNHFVGNRIEVDFFSSLDLDSEFNSSEILLPPIPVNVTPSKFGLRVLCECNLLGSGLAYYDANTAAVLKVDKALGLKKGVFTNEIKEYIIRHSQKNMDVLVEKFNLPKFTYDESERKFDNSVDFERYKFLYQQARFTA